MKLKFTLILSFFLGILFQSGMLNAQENFTLIASSHPEIDTFRMASALFGPTNCEIMSMEAEASLIEDLSGTTTACNGIVTDLTGKIALIDRGDCNFSTKVEFAETQGAVAAIICNNVEQDNLPLFGTSSTTIPSFRAKLEDCNDIKLKIEEGVTLKIEPLVIPDEFPDEVVVFEEDFDGGLNSFATIGVSSGLSSVPLEEAVFNWTENGRSSLLFSQGDIASPTACNGAAIFDLQRITTRDFTIDPPASSGSIMEGELISPVFDASAFNALALKFHQLSLPLNGDNAVAYSTDGGSTWSDPIVIPTENVFTSVSTNIVGTEYVRVPMPGLAGSSEARIKFIGSQDFYWWTIDDVKVVGLEGAEARLHYAFYTPLSYAVPGPHADADPFVFVGGVENLGGADLENGEMSVEVKNMDTKEVVFEKTIMIPTIPVGTVDTFDVVGIDDPYYPTGLDNGTYGYTISVEFPGSGEVDLSNNVSETFQFAITPDYFAKEDGNINNSLRVSSTQGWKIGSVYLTSPNITEPLVLNKITTSVQSDSVRLNDNYVRFVVAKLIEDYAFGGDFDRDNPDPSNHPDFDPPIVDIFHAFTTEQSTEVFEIPVSTKDNEILLDPGSQYAIFAAFDDIQAGDAAQPNNLLRLGINSIIPDNGNYIIFDNDSPAWFTGFSGFRMSPHMRLTVNMVESGVDNTPLPDHVFTISPNPASDYVLAKIDFDEPSNMNLMLADITGKIISMNDYESVTAMEERMDVSSLANGTYMMRVSTLEGTKTIKFVVQH